MSANIFQLEQHLNSRKIKTAKMSCFREVINSFLQKLKSNKPDTPNSTPQNTKTHRNIQIENFFNFYQPNINIENINAEYRGQRLEPRLLCFHKNIQT